MFARVRLIKSTDNSLRERAKSNIDNFRRCSRIEVFCKQLVEQLPTTLLNLRRSFAVKQLKVQFLCSVRNAEKGSVFIVDRLTP